MNAQLELRPPVVANERAAQQQLVMEHADLVKRIAYHLIARLPASVDVEDLIQAGTMGLLDAGRHYNGTMGASFETYAGIRIRGAMLDEVRRNDWAPRSVHRKARQVSEVVRHIEHETGREAEAAEVARRLGVSISEYHQIVQDSARCPLFSLSGDDDESPTLDVADPSGDPLMAIEDEGFREALTEAISALPDRERLAMSLYYEQELNLREIGAVMNITESRVCQIHGQALTRLRARLAAWTETPSSNEASDE